MHLDLPVFTVSTGLVELRALVMQVLCWGGQNSISTELREYYATHFDQLFKTNPLILLINLAAKPTLNQFAYDIYSKDSEWLRDQLSQKLDTSNCDDALRYMNTYAAILNKL